MLKNFRRRIRFLIVDSLVNSSSKVINNIEKILKHKNINKSGNLFFRKGDIRDCKFLTGVFEEFKLLRKPIKSVIHLAGLKSVSDSIIDPLNYWDVNVNGTINLLSVLKKIIATLLFLAVVQQYIILTQI